MPFTRIKTCLCGCIKFQESTEMKLDRVKVCSEDESS